MRDHQSGLLLGNPHILWQGALRLYQVQLTIPGTLNVEGATVVRIPVRASHSGRAGRPGAAGAASQAAAGGGPVRHRANPPGAIPSVSSTHIQVGTWPPGDPCPQAATVLTYSQSDSPASPHYDDQTKLFSRRQWATAYFCTAQVAAHAVSTTVLPGWAHPS